jgi:hypothetical protein
LEFLKGERNVDTEKGLGREQAKEGESLASPELGIDLYIGNVDKMEKNLKSNQDKAETKRSKWDSVLAKRKSSRIRNDGRTIMEKAQENKKKEDLEDNYKRGKRTSRTNHPSALLNVSKSIDLDLGKNEYEVAASVLECLCLMKIESAACR